MRLISVPLDQGPDHRQKSSLWYSVALPLLSLCGNNLMSVSLWCAVGYCLRRHDSHFSQRLCCALPPSRSLPLSINSHWWRALPRVCATRRESAVPPNHAPCIGSPRRGQAIHSVPVYCGVWQLMPIMSCAKKRKIGIGPRERSVSVPASSRHRPKTPAVRGPCTSAYSCPQDALIRRHRP